MAMGYLPLATLAAIHLGRPPGVTAWLTVDGGRGVLQAGGIGNITHHVIRLELERLGRAVGETPPEGNEELVQLILPMAFRNEPTTLTASLRDQSARRGAASPLCRASSDWYSVVLRAQCGGGRINSPKTMIFLVRNQSPPLIGRGLSPRIERFQRSINDWYVFNHRFPRLLRYQPMVRSLCLDTRYNARRFGSALVSRGSRDLPTYGVASGTSMVEP